MLSAGKKSSTAWQLPAACRSQGNNTIFGGEKIVGGMDIIRWGVVMDKINYN
jgi:hypothetical protein